jgi:hypothetical protein
MLRRLAERISMNRTVAGVHFPIDSWAGAVLGTAVGRAVLGRCGEKVCMNPETYVPDDFEFFDHDLVKEEARAKVGLRKSNEKVSAAEISIFSWLWSRALTEQQRV